MAIAQLSRKEEIWLACKAKTCCYVATVIPTGRDVWRIARALDAPPRTFLRAFESPTRRRDAFALDGSERRFRLALAKQPSRRRKAPAPCIFLMKTNAGQHRCGLGGLRPMSCRAFPSELSAGGIVGVNGLGCTCRDWNLTDVDVDVERGLVETRLADADEYAEVVARWNDLVCAEPDGHAFDFPSYCAYLLAAYDEIDANGDR
ncbi:MAG: YkgJ family cysteine cluster protein [Chloroflexota bacterium]